MPRGSYVPFKLPKVSGWVQKPQDPASIVTHISTGTKIKADLFRAWVHDPAYPNVPLPKWHPDVVAARQRRQRHRQQQQVCPGMVGAPLGAPMMPFSAVGARASYAPGAYNGSGFGPLPMGMASTPAAMQQPQVGLGLPAHPAAIGAPGAYDLPFASPSRPLPLGRATTPAVPATMQVGFGGQPAHLPQYTPGAYSTLPGSLPTGKKPVCHPVPALSAYPSPTSNPTPVRMRQDTTSTSPEDPNFFTSATFMAMDFLGRGVDGTVVSGTTDDTTPIDTTPVYKDIAFLESWLQTVNDQHGPSAPFFPMS